MSLKHISIKEAAVWLALITSFAIPSVAHTYFTPEDILLNQAFFLPPHNRETDERIERQIRRSAERREAEQAAAFTKPEPESVAEELHGAAPAADPLSGVSENDLELLRAIQLLDRRDERMLGRVQSQQASYTTYYGGGPQAQVLHGGAPLPLAPSGPGTALGGLAVIGGVLWTIRRLRKQQAKTVRVYA